MNLVKALFIARKVMIEVKDTEFYDENEEREFEKKYGVSHAEIISAMPFIEALDNLGNYELYHQNILTKEKESK